MVDLLTRVGRVFGISNREGRDIAASFATGGLTQAALTTLQSLGDAPRTSGNIIDTSGPPAGVDSPATLAPTSQTSFTGGPTGDGPGLLGGGRDARTNQAFIGGGLIPGLIQGGRTLLSRPGVGGALTGIGAGLGFDVVTDMFGNQKKLVITRKLQRDVKKVFMMSGGDIGFVADNSMMLFGKRLNEDQILMILFKTFKNQGPYVTKAAVRKTRSTIRKMETLCDLKDRLCPPKRRAPARRRTMSAQTITQVK